MKLKFNGIDFLIIIILIAALGVGSWFLLGRSQQAALSQNKTVELMVELTDKTDEFAKIPQVGDTVVMGEKEKMDAVVTKVEVNPALWLGYDIMSGRILESTIPGKYDVQITVQAEGNESPQEISINGSGVRVGMGVAMKAKNWAGYGYALAVDAFEPGEVQ